MMGRPLGASALALALGALLVACGSSSDNNSSCEKFHAGPAYIACVNGEPIPPKKQHHTAADAPLPAEEAGGPLMEVGTMTGEVAEATTFRERFQLGPLLYSDEATPPQEALDACPLPKTDAEVAASVYARGIVTFTYTGGSLPASFNLGFHEQPVKGEALSGSGLLAFDLGRGWVCDSEMASATMNFEPGESQQIPFWFVGYNVLSNSRPKVPTSIYDTWHFTFLPEVSNAVGIHVSGPGAGTPCDEEYESEAEYEAEQSLFLFNQSGGCRA